MGQATPLVPFTLDLRQRKEGARLIFEYRNDAGVVIGGGSPTDADVLSLGAVVVSRFSRWSDKHFHGSLLRSERELIKAFLLWLSKGAPCDGSDDSHP